MAKLFALLFLIVSFAAAAEVYRSVGADGSVTYSDTPGPSSEKVKLPQVMIYSPPPLPQRKEEVKPPEEPLPYQQMSIVEPQPDETIWDNQGIIELVVALKPDLKVSLGHRILVTIGGVPHGEPRATTTIHIADLDRGTHKLGAQVVDVKGKVLTTARSVTVHLHRQSIFFPNRQSPPQPSTFVAP